MDCAKKGGKGKMGLLEEKILFILGYFFVKTLLRKTAVNQKNQRGEEEKGDRGFRLFGITVKLFPPLLFVSRSPPGKRLFLKIFRLLLLLSVSLFILVNNLIGQIERNEEYGRGYSS